MKIGLIASNWRPISGVEKNIFAPGLIIQALADGLVDRGHDVTLFAPKDTQTKAKLISEDLNSAYNDYQDLWQQDLATYLQIEQEYEMVLLSKAFEMAKDGCFDLVHAHKTNIEPFFTNLISCPLVITSHNSYLKTKAPVFSKVDEIRLKRYKDSCYYTALSEAIKKEVDLNFVGVVYNGIDLAKFSFEVKGGDDLVFAGRMIESKGADLAVEVSQKTGHQLQMIGDIRNGKSNQEYWEKLKSIIDESELVNYVGFVSHDKMSQYYQKAKVLVFPIRESEAFGLTMVEAMACGTPVVAFDLGSVSEIIKDGETGFVCPLNDIEAIVQAVNKIYAMSDEDYQQMRKNCRKHAQDNFSIDRMVDGYEKVYQKVIKDWQKRKGLW